MNQRPKSKDPFLEHCFRKHVKLFYSARGDYEDPLNM